MTDDQIMLYLYKNVGLLWEKTLSRDENREMCSMSSNKGLWTFFHKNKHVSYSATSTSDFDVEKLKNNTFVFTNSQSSIVKSLMQHLRNSIMHGNYQIKRSDQKIFCEFEDYLRETLTMFGRIDFDKLRDLVNTIKNYGNR